MLDDPKFAEITDVVVTAGSSFFFLFRIKYAAGMDTEVYLRLIYFLVNKLLPIR